MNGKHFSILVLIFTIPMFLFGQEELTYEFKTDIYINYPYLSIPRASLEEANTLRDLNKHHKSSWIAKFKSVELSTYQDGKRIVTPSKDSILTKKQKQLLYSADYGSEINVKVIYKPKNELSKNEEHEMNFSFTVDPDSPASYVGGTKELNQYLESTVTKKVDPKKIKQHQLATVSFTVNEEGSIINPKILHSTDDEATDKILLDAICNMPDWLPAQYADGTKTQQDHVLTVGDMNSCIVNLVNIRKHTTDFQE